MQHIQTGYSSSVEANYITTNNITTNNHNSALASIAMTIIGGLFSIIMAIIVAALVVVTAPVSIPLIIYSFSREKKRLDTVNRRYDYTDRLLGG